MKGKGLGAILMKKLIRYCRERKIGEIVGDVLATNSRMLALARDLGFEITASEDPSVVRAKLVLAAVATAYRALFNARNVARNDRAQPVGIGDLDSLLVDIDQAILRETRQGSADGFQLEAEIAADLSARHAQHKVAA